MHAREVTAPTVTPYMPPAHTVQALVPAASAVYLPASHAVHVAGDVDRARLLYVPIKHPVHTTDDTAWLVSLYVPAAQAVQYAEDEAAATLT